MRPKLQLPSFTGVDTAEGGAPRAAGAILRSLTDDIIGAPGFNPV